MTTSVHKDSLKVLAPLLLLVFIDTLSNGLYFPLLAPIIYSTKHGILASDISLSTRNILYGVAMAAHPIMMFFSAPILGDASDHFGRKRVLMLSIIGTAIGFGLSATGVELQLFGLFLLGRIIDGVTAGNFAIAQAAIIDLSSPKSKAKNLGLMIFANSIGFIIGPMLGGLLANNQILSWFTFSTPLYAAAILSIGNSFLIFNSVPETFIRSNGEFKIITHKALGLFRDAFMNKSIRRLSIILFLMLLGWGGYIQIVSALMIQAFDYQVDKLSWFMTTMACTFAIGSTFAIRLLLKVTSEHKACFTGLVMISIGLITTLFLQTIVPTWIAMSIIAIGVVFSDTTLLSMLSERVSDEQQGWIMGITGAILAASLAISALLNGVLSDVSIYLPIATAAVCAVASVLVLLGLKQSGNATEDTEARGDQEYNPNNPSV